MVHESVREKKHRLSREAYRGHKCVAFTICTQYRASIFVEPGIISECLVILRDALSQQEARNWIYLFMPDHLHLLVEGLAENSDLWALIVQFKQRTGRLFSERGLHMGWQKDFYDHILRREEDLEKQIRYILANPVRKGLVSDWKVYPFKGSLDQDIANHG